MASKRIFITKEYVNSFISKKFNDVSIIDIEGGVRGNVRYKCASCGDTKNIIFDNLRRRGKNCSCKKQSHRNGYDEITLEYIAEFFNKNNIDFTILDTEYMNAKHKIKLKCNKDGYIFYRSWDNLKQGRARCKMCINYSTLHIVGFNDIATTNPEMVKYLKNEDDSKKYRANSNKFLEMKCDRCGKEMLYSPNKLFTNNNILPCKVCSDGVTLPNKIIRNVLKEINVEYEPEKRFGKSKFRFDCYIPSYNLVIEMDGKQHKCEVEHFSMNGFSQKERDIEKENILITHGVKLVRVDCSKSDMLYIRDSIIKELGSILNIKDLDWKNVFLASSNSFIIDACKIRKDSGNTKTTSQIAKELGMTKSTIKKYLILGNDIGICEYNTEVEAKRIRDKNFAKRNKKE